MENKETYFQFPLFLLRELFIDKEKTLNNIISYGIYRFSKRIEYQLSEVARQAMYGYYRGPVTNELAYSIQSYVDSDSIEINEDYNGFDITGQEFDPEDEVDQILKIFEKDNEFKEKAIEFYQIKEAFRILGIKGTYDHCLKVGKRIEKTIPEKEPLPMIRTKKVFEFRDNEQSEFDLIQLAAYISVRSIIGSKRAFCRTNNGLILSRAFGYSSTKHLPENMEPIIKELFDKYSKRYHIYRVLEFLELKWNILRYSRNMRGMYIGLGNKTTIDKLALFAETKKLKNQKENLKRKKNEAREKALQQLNKGL